MSDNNKSKEPMSVLWQLCGFLVIGATLLILPAFMAITWWNLALHKLFWVISAIIAICSLSWWVWTIVVIIRLAKMREREKYMITEILEQLSKIKEEIKKSFFK